jgi:hypothetical protein
MKLSAKLKRRNDLRDDVVWILDQALLALNLAPNFQVRDTTSYDIASHIRRVLYRLRSPPD